MREEQRIRIDKATGRAIQAGLTLSDHQGLKVEITRAVGMPAWCKVWRDGVLVFSGREPDNSEYDGDIVKGDVVTKPKEIGNGG